MWEQPYYDSAEIKLVEWHLRETLDDLGRRMKGHYSFRPLVGYYLPKDTKSARKYAFRPFLDEIVSVAAVLAVGRRLEGRMDRGGVVSFGNRLDNVFHSDRLFRPWYLAWDSLGAACQRSARHNPCYLRTDVRQFYPEIPVANLESVLARLLPADPIFPLFRSLVRQRCPLVPHGKGLPAGPAASGFIANLYLLPLDETIKRKWRAGARFRRYVDDIFFFTVKREYAVRAYRSLQDTLGRQFGLRLHGAAKLEIDFSRDPLGRGSSFESRDYAERLFDDVYGSLFRLDPGLWSRYRREPARFLKWYARGLRWLGIFVSTDWLAQRLLSIQRAGRGSRWLEMRGRYQLRIPDIELYGIEKRGMKGWAEEFERRNPRFMVDLRKLQRVMGRVTAEAYRDLGDVREQSKADLKGRVFALRSYAARLAMMPCGRHRHIFDMLIDHPWILEPSLCVNAFLSMPDAREKLIWILRSRRQEIVRAKAAWALGELGDLGSVEVLWDAARLARGEIVRRSALDALLRIDYWDPINPSWVVAEARRQADPGIRKFFYLILGRIRSAEALEFLRGARRSERDSLCRLAIAFSLEEAATLYRVMELPSSRAERRSLVPFAHPADRR